MSAEELKAIYETGLIPLTEDQGGIYKSGRDYLIFETMRVKKDDTVTFVQGARLFFHSNAKITVHGTLKFNGTEEEPVTIGKLNVTIPRIAPKKGSSFDSTSFYVYRNASLIMRNVKLADTTISVRLTDSTSGFTFENVRGSGNRILLPDTLLYMWPGSCVTCVKTNTRLSIPCIPPQPRNGLLSGYYGQWDWKRYVVPIRIVIGAGILSASGAWYYHNDKAADAHRAYERYQGVESEDVSDVNARSEMKGFVDRQVDINRIALRNRNLSGFAAGCGIAAITLTFVFGGKEK